MIRNNSLLRDLTDNELKKLKLTGYVLDIGGGKNVRYNYILSQKKIDCYESINIEKIKNHTYLMDLNQKIKLDKKYNNIICIHTLEHIYKFENIFLFDKNLISGGVFTIIFPFLFRVHGHPYDYTRLTSQYILDLYQNKKEFKLNIKELGFGVFSAAYSLIEPLFDRFGLRILGKILRFLTIGIDKTLCFISSSYKKYYGPKAYPLGYVVNIKRI